MKKLLFLLLLLPSCINKPIYEFSAFDRIVYKNDTKMYRVGYFYSHDHDHILVLGDTLLNPNTKIIRVRKQDVHFNPEVFKAKNNGNKQ